MASPMWLSASSVWRSIRNNNVPTGAVILTQEQLDYAAEDVELLCEMDHPLHQQIAQEGLGEPMPWNVEPYPH